ncbi:MAG: NCS2 family permease [Bacteroidales bacterium]|nr:NCS2 family permease [Bacteroidales bacterium]
MLQKLFGFDTKTMKVKTEIIAGITTFLAMAYILAVNPEIFTALEKFGMPTNSVFTATALSAIVGTLVMSVYAKKPFALAPGMGLNAFFVYTVCLGMGHSWQFAVTAVFLEGILFVILTLTNVRTIIVDAIPLSLRNAISAGIGLFIALIGLKNGKIIVANDTTFITLGDIFHGPALLAVIGFAITSVLLVLKVPGNILIGIIATALIGMIPVWQITDAATGEVMHGALTTFNGVVRTPPSIDPIFCKFQWHEVLSLDMLIVVFTFLFIDLFDTIGTIIGVSQKAGEIDANGHIKNIGKAFMADSIGTMASACFGTSTVAVYVESAAGVGAGGRSGLTSFTTACCFAISLFFAPIFLGIPSSATTAALVIVGLMMLDPIKKLDLNDFSESIPAFLTIILMPFAYSISDGILIGMISYVVINALCGKFKKISPAMWIFTALFIAKYLFL